MPALRATSTGMPTLCEVGVSACKVAIAPIEMANINQPIHNCGRYIFVIDMLAPVRTSPGPKEHDRPSARIAERMGDASLHA